MKATCKSQYLAIYTEAKQLLDQGYTKKAVFNHFFSQKKITMSYTAWTRIVNNYNKKSPFSEQKKTTRKTGQSLGSKKGKFSHSNDPYPTDFIVTENEKEKEKPFNLIKKKK